MSAQDFMETASLREILEFKIPALLETWEEKRILIAQSTLAEFLQKNRPLPEGVSYVQRPLLGRRVQMRGSRLVAGPEPITAHWPQDKLIASRFPILVCPLRGAADIRLGDYTLQLPEGQFCLLPPEIPRDDGSASHNHGKSCEDDRCEVLWLKGGEGGLETWICHSQNERHWIGPATGRVAIPCLGARYYFASLENEAGQQATEATWICHGLLKVLFGIVLRELKNARTSQRLQPQQLEGAGSHWNPIAFAQDYAQSHLDEHLTIRQVARLAYMAESAFMARFRAETGQTFNQFLTQCRMEKAQALLRDTDWEITAIANSIGINPSHLRRLFARYANVSPQAFRRSSQNKPFEKSGSFKLHVGIPPQQFEVVRLSQK